MRSFKHLEKVEVTEFDWTSQLLRKSLPRRAFVNTLTANFFLSLEAMLGESLGNIKSIRTYFRL